MKRSICCAVLLATAAGAHATMIVGPWMPIFKGVDHAVGTNLPPTIITILPFAYTNARVQVVHAMRIDLTDPDVKLFTDPAACTNCSSIYGLQIRGNTTSGFLETYKVQGAINANFSQECCSQTPGTLMHALGLLISTGQVVTPTWTPTTPLQHSQTYYSALLFNTNNAATFVPTNWPSTNLSGIYTAVTGSRTLLTNGVISLFMNNPNYDDVDPRTVLGLTEEGRYLILMTIDGRQSPQYGFPYTYSEGANDTETTAWLLSFGAYHAVSVDGGGSATMVMEDCPGKAIQLNRPINAGRVGSERVVAAHLGVYAKPLPGFINDLAVIPGSTTATFTWTTLSNASSQVEYGLTANYGQASLFDPAPVTNHAVTLNGLVAGTKYFFRVVSQTESAQYSLASCFSTTNYAAGTAGLLFDLPNVWKYNTNNLDGVNWKAPAYNDTTWPSGPGLLYIEDNTFVSPRNTPLPMPPPPPPPAVNYPYITYYFRTQFAFTNNPVGVTLIFSNYLDDGAVFYLNGVEIFRAFISPWPTPIFNATLATGYNNCPSFPGDATCPYVTNILVTNLVAGTNLLAAELHNYRANSPDVTFGSALTYVLPPPPPPPDTNFISNLAVFPKETNATITWLTLSNATTQVEYGLTPALGSSTPLDPALVTNHSVMLTNLQQLTTYYFRAISVSGTTQYVANGLFATVPFYEEVIPLTNTWRYTTNNLDGLSWQTVGYDDSGWLGQGPALLYIENNPEVTPKNTLLTGVPNSLPPTYYFRTHFAFPGSLLGFALVFTNFIDDGAVFYLNGTEIQQVRMAPPPQTIAYTSLSTTSPPSGDAIFSSPDVFRIAGDLLTNMLAGDNVLAVEVHQNVSDSPDIVFGASLGYARALASETKLRITYSENVMCVFWDGTGMALQRSQAPGPPWSDVPGPVNTSPYCVTNPASLYQSVFYRLRN